MPDYARPLEGSFGQGVRTGVSEALRQFVELIRSPSGDRGQGREVYAALGAGELREGRTLDALQSAYRVGARVAWRRLAAAATRAGLEPELLSLLAESIFAYIEELSADSVEGYAEARSRLEGERRGRRRELVTLLVRDPPAAEADLRAVAEAGGLASAANGGCARVRRGTAGSPRRPTPPPTLSPPLWTASGARSSRDPDGPGRGVEIELALESARTHAALGPTGPLSEAWPPPGRSPARLCTSRRSSARSMQHAPSSRVEEGAGRTQSCCCSRTERSSSGSGQGRLAASATLSPKARRRMEETALAYVQQQGNAAAMARALGTTRPDGPLPAQPVARVARPHARGPRRAF